MNGIQPKFWITHETEPNALIYYEKRGELYTGLQFQSKTFDISYTNYTKDPQQGGCLVAKPSKLLNKFDIVDYDCNKVIIMIIVIIMIG